MTLATAYQQPPLCYGYEHRQLELVNDEWGYTSQHVAMTLADQKHVHLTCLVKKIIV